MKDDIFERTSFDDIGDNVAYLKYDKYDSPLSCDVEFDTTEEKTIVLRNRSTGRLERLKYCLSGYNRAAYRSGYSELWGDIVTEGRRHAVLFFDFDYYGRCARITVIFCARTMPHDVYAKLCSDVRYAAEATARY